MSDNNVIEKIDIEEDVREEPEQPIKKKRGRPRIHPIKIIDHDAPARGKGRPKKLYEFYEDDKFNEKAYYLSRKTKLNERNSTKIRCSLCEKMVRRDYMSIHLKTKLCLKNSK